jgi:hypothetical protein
MPFKQIPTYSSDTNQWSVTIFETRVEWIKYLESQFKFVGDYNLKNVDVWVQPRLQHERTGKYTKILPKTLDYKNYWTKEGYKCTRGVIFNNVYVPGYFYFYLNYFPIVFKEKSKIQFPEIWDSDLYYFLYLALCEAKRKFGVVNKKRQWGFSYKNAAIIGCDLWFLKKQRIKILSTGENYLKDIWGKLNDLRNHLQSETGWKRHFGVNKNAARRWEMKWKTSNSEGESEVGRLNTLDAINTKTDVTNAVGGYNTRIYFEEAGVDNQLDTKISFVKPSIMEGNIATGACIVGGSVGELKDCEPLRRISYNPEEYDFLGVQETIKSDKLRSLFISTSYNYTHGIVNENNEVIETIKCYDRNGNSDVAQALKYILEAREKLASDPKAYQTAVSQYPISLDEAYNSRENNIFPTQIINPWYLKLEDQKQTTVKINKVDDKLELSYENIRIVNELKLKTNSYREPVVVIVEQPIDNPPPFLYFAGIDPVKELKGFGESLQSGYIYRNSYTKINEDGTSEVISGRFVAYCTGRFFDDKDTFELFRNFIKLYNASAAIENDQPSFIDFMRKHKEYQYILKRKQIPILKELNVNSSVSDDEYGIRMNTGGTMSQVKKHLHLTLIGYCKEIIGTRTVNDIVENIYGVERISDPMLLKEMLNHNGAVGKDDGNYDRLCAAGLALLTAQCYDNIHVKHKVNSGVNNNIIKPQINSLVRTISLTQNNKIPRSALDKLWN